MLKAITISLNTHSFIPHWIQNFLSFLNISIKFWFKRARKKVIWFVTNSPGLCGCKPFINDISSQKYLVIFLLGLFVPLNSLQLVYQNNHSTRTIENLWQWNLQATVTLVSLVRPGPLFPCTRVAELFLMDILW